MQNGRKNRLDNIDFRRIPSIINAIIDDGPIGPERLQNMIANLEKSISILKNFDQISIPEIKESRNKICLECSELKDDMCLKIKKGKGCSACTEPWNALYHTCPLDKWKLI